jgi:hypothetical protein
MNTATWLSQVPDKKWLRQIVMPGSHDAGVYGTAQVIVKASALVKKEYTVCQHSDFAKQAAAGSRFFDCRVFLRELPKAQQTPTQKYENRLGHFAKEKVTGSKEPTLGGYGGALVAVLVQSFEFVLGNPTEFVILRFSHTFHPTECVKQIKEIIKSDPRFGNALHKATGNIAIKTVGELRGKVIMVFDEKFNHHITPSEGVHRFKKYSDGLTHIDGLSTCGKFSSSMKMSEVHAGATSAVKKHLEHPGDPGTAHLHFVYWQQTAGVFGEKDVFKTTVAQPEGGKAWSGGAHANLDAFIGELQAETKKSGRTAANVISHDFVTADTCAKIIALNPECT